MAGQQDDARNGDRKPGSGETGDKGDGSAKKPPPAGPHADPSLTNEEATPGAGTLPPADGEPGDGGSVSS